MLPKNFVKEKLNANQSVLGSWSIINSHTMVDVAARAGLDFQILDMEHGLFELSSIDHCIRVCEAAHCSPLVRIPRINASTIQNVIDLGAHGFIVPQIRNSQDCSTIINYSCLPPEGQRGFNPFTVAGGYDPTVSVEHTKLRANFGLTGVIVENKESYSDIDKILTVKGLDLIYIGIYDYSYSCGLKGNINHPDILDFTRSCLHKIKKAGKFAGVMVKTEEEIERYLELGANFIVHGVDTFTYFSAIKNKVNSFKSVLNQISKMDNSNEDASV